MPRFRNNCTTACARVQLRASLNVAGPSSLAKPWTITESPLRLISSTIVSNRCCSCALRKLAVLTLMRKRSPLTSLIRDVHWAGYGVGARLEFMLTSIAFAGLSLWGYTTKKDISAWGSFLIMGVIGLLVASIVNIFLGSPAVMFAISALGVLIFAGLTAYDTQNIKNTYIAHAQHGDAEWLGKAAIMGALNLYLDFINMFMFLLQFLGNRE